MTNLPYSAQKNDARHEEYNKKGQNIFKGEKVEDFDDLWTLRSKMFDNSDTNDRADMDQAKVPKYDNLIYKIRVGLRKSEYYSNPSTERELISN